MVAVEGIAMTWIGPPPGIPEDGNLAGDGSETSHRIIAEARALWEDPIEVDHPSWAHPFVTAPGDPAGVIVTLLHLARGRGRVLQAPVDAFEDVFGTDDEIDAPEETDDVQG